MFDIKKPDAPYVYILGAGPGDPLLLTLKALQVIKIADVIIYDRLVSQDILNLIPNTAKKIYAGKSCKNHFLTQDEINQLLVDEAKKGQIIVRLKGGDPYIFGRGGEEAIFVKDNNIAFEVVPGVNAADGCGVYAGIPLTHRGISNGVVFLTGHLQKDEYKINWQSYISDDITIVVFMGLANIDKIINELLNLGKRKDTGVAAIRSGTTKEQEVIITTLENTLEDIKDLRSPVILIIGDVVNLRNSII